MNKCNLFLVARSFIIVIPFTFPMLIERVVSVVCLFLRYLSTYETFKYLLSSSSSQYVQKFISRDRPLRDYRREIERFKKLASDVASLPVLVPMNLFQIDCSSINKVM